MEKLSNDDLKVLVRSVFPLFPEDRWLGILVDIPRDARKDNPAWKERRRMAAEWCAALKDVSAQIPIEGVRLIAFPDTGSNNGDLPPSAVFISGDIPDTAQGLERLGTPVPFEEIFRNTQLFLAPTEYSTTAPLKNAAKIFGFRAATMPGFSARMIPALRIDYNEVSRRVNLLKERLDRAEAAEIMFTAEDLGNFQMRFDLRRTTAHTSSGRFPERGTAGNLPSGETYIVPFEGRQGDPSRTEGTLPVQIGPEIILFRVKGNRAFAAHGEGPEADAEQEHLRREPAFGNMAELGFGVLEDFGLRPIGEILLDEKLGLHVAFGRSDHFGGLIGPAAFSSPREVVHIDRIYIPATQPRVRPRSVTLEFSGHERELIMADGRYLIF